MSRYLVAVRDGSETLYATATSELDWTTMRGLAGTLSAEQRDAAIAAAVEAGLPYDVVEHETEAPHSSHRIGGTAALIAL